VGRGGIIILNLAEFLEEIKPSIKWSSNTGFHRCSGCGRQFDSTEKLLHWPKHCSLSKDKTVQKLRADVLSANFPEAEKSAIKEAGLDWYQNQIKITAILPIDFKPTRAKINEELYPSSSLKELSTKDIQDLADLFSGKIKCRVKQVYTKDPIIDQLPMNDLDPNPDMFSCPEWLKDHNQAISETHVLGLYAESIKKGVCDLSDCFCHELAAMKNQEEKEDE
jgi:hypothetical protein